MTVTKGEVKTSNMCILPNDYAYPPSDGSVHGGCAGTIGSSEANNQQRNTAGEPTQEDGVGREGKSATFSVGDNAVETANHGIDNADGNNGTGSAAAAAADNTSASSAAINVYDTAADHATVLSAIYGSSFGGLTSFVNYPLGANEGTALSTPP